MNLSHLLDQQADSRPSQWAILQSNQKISYLELKERSLGIAKQLHHSGIKADDKVFMFIPMGIDLYCTLFAIWRLGAVAMFADPGAGRQHLEACCKRVKPKAFIGTTKAQLLRLLTPSLRKVPLAFSNSFCIFTKRLNFDAIKSYETTSRDKEDAALITFTSGSTGIPKAAVRTHGFLTIQRDILQKNLQLEPGTIDLATLPVFALINLACGLTTLIPDADLRTPGDYEAAPVIEQIKSTSASSSVASPSFFKVMCERCENQKETLPPLKALFTGGAPVYPELLTRLKRLAPNAKVVAVYGSTEAEPIAEFEFNDMSSDILQSMSTGSGLYAGPPVEDIQLRIIANQHDQKLGPWTDLELENQTLEPGKVGEIIVAGPHVLKGYMDGQGDHETKISVGHDIWHRTGDLGTLDKEGLLWLQGRASAAIKDSKGELYPFAIETAAMTCESIQRVALCLFKYQRTLVVETDQPFDQIKENLKPLCDRYFIENLINMKIPLDRRHNAKVDYPSLYKMLETKGASNGQ